MKKKRTKKPIRKLPTKKLPIKKLTIALVSNSPYINEWFIYEDLGGFTGKNLVKILQPIQESLVNSAGGPTKQKVLGVFEFYPDAFFNDDLEFNADAGLMIREVKPNEEIYKGYMNVIAERKKQMIEMEAKQKIKEVK